MSIFNLKKNKKKSEVLNKYETEGYIQELSAKESVSLEKEMKKDEGEALFKVISLFYVDANGKKLFENEKYEQLKELPLSAIKELNEEINKFNNEINGDAEEKKV